MPETTEDRLLVDLRRYGTAVEDAAGRFGLPAADYPVTEAAPVADPGSLATREPVRRRRALVLVAAAAVLVAVVAAVALVRRAEESSPAVDTPTITPVVPTAEPFTDGTVLLWLPYEAPPQFLYAGSDRPVPLLIGDPPQAGRSVVATVNTTAGFLVQGSLFLVDRAGTVTPTGLAGDRVVANRGDASAFYVLQSRQLTRYVLPDGVDGTWAIPDGWELPSGGSTAEALDGQIVLQRRDTTSADHDIALWTLGTGELRPIGRARWVVDATVHPEGRPIVAWVDSDCDRLSTGCGLVITDLATMESRTVARPEHGYIGGGAFSDDGRRLAVFAAGQENMPVDPSAELAVIDVDSLAMRVVAGTDVPVGEPFGSATWTFDGRSVIFHGLSETRVVDVDTGAIRTLPWEVTYGMATIP